jgi:hypothetical protein
MAIFLLALLPFSIRFAYLWQFRYKNALGQPIMYVKTKRVLTSLSVGVTLFGAVALLIIGRWPLAIVLIITCLVADNSEKFHSYRRAVKERSSYFDGSQDATAISANEAWIGEPLQERAAEAAYYASQQRIAGMNRSHSTRKGTSARMSNEHTLRLPKDWYEYVVVKGVDEARPGIYEWNIDGCGTYIGKYTHISRPVREYGKNVYNLLNGKAYRRSKPDAFRRIHRELAQAHRERRRIRLTILENVDLSRINERERQLIAERGSLNGR